MTRPESTIPPKARPVTMSVAGSERPARTDATVSRPQQAGSVQRSGVSRPPIDHPRTAEPSRQPLDRGNPSPASSEFGNPGGNWLG